ncbi:protein kinase [Candidatus Woesearchaeota archaeon]|nr:protein kinase [Candidatus Woesearchaeota archaeon]
MNQYVPLSPVAQDPPAVSFHAFGRSYAPSDLLAQGGEGQVYRSSQNQGRVVKIPQPALRDSSSLTAEATLGRVVEHAHLARVLGIESVVITRDDGTEKNCPAVEFPDYGSNLHRAFYDGHVSLQQAMGYLAQVASVLPYLTQQGITHRDVNKGNIFVDGQHVVLGDLGLALVSLDSPLLGKIGELDPASRTFFERRATHPSTTGSTGTCSPEQVCNIEKVGPASDVYSMAAAAYGLLTKVDFNRALATSIGNKNDRNGVLKTLDSYVGLQVNQLFRSLPQKVAAAYGIQPDSTLADILTQAASPLQQALRRNPAERPTPQSLYQSISDLAINLGKVSPLYASVISSVTGETSSSSSPARNRVATSSNPSPVPSDKFVDLERFFQA